MTKRHTEIASDKRDQQPDASRTISRRHFLRGIGAVAAGVLTAGCQPRRLAEAPESVPTVAPTIPPTDTPPVPPTEAPTIPPTAKPTVAPTTGPAPASLSKVAIAQTPGYDRDLVRQQMQALLDGLGGLDDVIDSGDRVAIKVNLTGGTHFQAPAGLTATESHLTHPEVVRALGELLRDAGARDLFIVEAVYDEESYAVFGYKEVAKALDATLIDLNVTEPYSDFAATPVEGGGFVYEDFIFNHILEEIDAFVSVAKMKCHFNCGVTNSMKNLIGLVPANHYRLDESHWWRSALHGQSNDEAKSRLPRVILDLNRARPIHLALIDGIKSGEGGEVPRGSFAPVAPGVLIAGKDPVAADAVATAVMGFDPTVEPPTEPFLRGDNYLNMARELGLGTNLLDEIEIAGASIDDVRYSFEPGRRM